MIARLTVQQAAVAAQRHPDTVRKALEADELHGTQAVARGKWSIREDCLEAWLDGIPCEHRSARVTPLRRSA